MTTENRMMPRIGESYRDNAKLDMPFQPLRFYLPSYTACPFCGSKGEHPWAKHDPGKCGETRAHMHRHCDVCDEQWVQGTYEDATWLARRKHGVSKWWRTSLIGILLHAPEAWFVVGIVGALAGLIAYLATYYPQK